MSSEPDMANNEQYSKIFLLCCIINIKSPGTTLLNTTGQRVQSARAPLSWTTPTPTTTLRPQLPSDRPPHLLLREHPQQRPTASGREFRPPTTTAGPLTPPWWPTWTAAWTGGWRRRRSPWPSRGWRRPSPPWPEPPPRSETASPCSRRTWPNWRLPLPEVWRAVWSSNVLHLKKKQVLLKVRQSVVQNKRAEGLQSRLFLFIYESSSCSKSPPRKSILLDHNFQPIQLPVSRCWPSIMILSEELLLT